MFNQKNWNNSKAIIVRILQLVLLSMAGWFIYWAHIYEITTWNKSFVDTLQSSFPNVLIYLILIAAVIGLEVIFKKTNRFSGSLFSAGAHENLVLKNKLVEHELQSKKTPVYKIVAMLLCIGVLILAYSIISSLTIFAFIGLSFTFWGILFLFARPTKFVRSTIIDSTAISYYETLDRAIDDLKYTGKSTCIPPYPKDASLPEHLKGLKDLVVLISAKDTLNLPTADELAKRQLLVKNPNGICIASPGSGLLSLFEDELKFRFTEINQETLYQVLQRMIVNNLELATNFEIEPENNLIHARITNSAYKNLYSKKRMLKSVYTVGCPLTSAVACALAKATGKPVMLVKSSVSSNLKTIDVWYQVVGG